MSDPKVLEAIKRMEERFADFARQMIAAQEQISAAILKACEEQRQRHPSITNVIRVEPSQISEPFDFRLGARSYVTDVVGTKGCKASTQIRKP